MSDITIRRAAAEDVPAIRAFMLSIFEHDYGYGYRPQWHWDYDDLRGVYLENPRHTLILASDDATGQVVGTGAVRSGGPTSETLPSWLVERYRPSERTAQLVRVFVHLEYRRRGIARGLVEELLGFVRAVGGYDVVCLHTENAVDFWQAMGCHLVYDDRVSDGSGSSVHFELATVARSSGHAT
ncbi:MAG: GNAT family N-acetyltransferase [Chloroflexi bacterium]|nr:GNAT family N-acetyltransferase [Chloroflexota bacterium]